MLEQYEKDQAKACQLLNSNIFNNKLNHAYLFIANDYAETYCFAKNFIKSVINTQNIEDNIKTDIYKRIDNETFVDLTTIDCDGQFIKKEQMDNLQVEFSNKAIENEKKFYIIKNADRLNKQSANSILKFLEEPEENIIAILISKNYYSVLDTIKSRCTTIILNSNNLKCNSNYKTILDNLQYLNNKIDITDEILAEEIINNVIKFVIYFEEYKMDTLLHVNRLWHDYFKDKEMIDLALNIILYVYRDVISKKFQKENIVLFKNLVEIDKIDNLNSLDSIIEKINIVSEIKNRLYSNVNLNLLIDKLIIELGRV